MNKRVLIIAFAAFLGMVDAFYISIKRGQGPVPCHITHGCEEVLNSRFSEVVGIPISWLGLAFYLGVFSCAIFEVSGALRTQPLILGVASVAFLISLVLIGIQALVLHAYCEYCLLSAILVTTIFSLSVWSRFKAQGT